MEIKINLLPEYRKKEMAESRKFRLVLKLGIATLFILFLFYAFLLGLERTLEMNLASFYKSQEMMDSRESLEKIREYDEEFGKINSLAGQAATLEKDQFYWSDLFARLSGNLPDGVVLTDLATKEYGVFLAGKASNRENLMNFKERLAQEKCLSDVNLPLSNLISKEDIIFQMDFKINKECLHPYSGNQSK